MVGYWADPERTEPAFDHDGWLRTGDAAYVDEDGFLFIVGRMRDAFVTDGEVVHPGLAERVLLQHPAVAEACMIGGARGRVAYVVLVAGARGDVAGELVSWCAERLGSRDRPAAIEVVPALPRNANGKILRHLVSAG
jgi:acyl-coenzyme A synthetase/AMP-(fatty) acid ligase